MGRGQFLSQDPVFWEVGQNLENPQSLNSYGYAENNPIIKKDPNGLFAQILLGAGAGIIGQYAYDVSRNLTATGFNVGAFYQNLSSLETYTVRGGQGATVAFTGGLSAVANLGLAAQLGIVGVTSGGTGVIGNLALGQPVTTQSVAADAFFGATSFGILRSVPKAPGRLPNFGTQAFFEGKHTQQSALNLSIESAFSYSGNVLGNSSVKVIPHLSPAQSGAINSLWNAFAPANSSQVSALQNIVSAFKDKI